jgi:hypothetical protein
MLGLIPLLFGSDYRFLVEKILQAVFQILPENLLIALSKGSVSSLLSLGNIFAKIR